MLAASHQRQHGRTYGSREGILGVSMIYRTDNESYLILGYNWEIWFIEISRIIDRVVDTSDHLTQDYLIFETCRI